MTDSRLRLAVDALRRAQGRSAVEFDSVGDVVRQQGRQMLERAHLAGAAGVGLDVQVRASVAAMIVALETAAREIDTAIEIEIKGIEQLLDHPEHSLGATPYRGQDRRPYEIGAGDPYRHSREYEDFDHFVAAQAAALDVTLTDRREATGLWEGSGEPASDLWVRGEYAAVAELSRRICDRYNQDAVMVVTIDPDGPHTWRRYPLPHADPGRGAIWALTGLRQAGLSGARIVDGRLEILEPPPLTSAQLELLERVIGKPEERTARVSFVEQSPPGAAVVQPAPFAGMVPGTPAGAGASWGTVSGTAEGLSRRHPGLRIDLAHRGGAVVIGTFEMTRPEGRHDAMTDLVAEADKHEWTLVRDVPGPPPAAGSEPAGAAGSEPAAFGFTPVERTDAHGAPTTRWTRLPAGPPGSADQ